MAPSIIAYLVLSGIVAYWASKWNRSGPAWFFLALLLSPLLASLILIIGGRRAVENFPCPGCGRPVPVSARYCPNCGRDLDARL